MRIINPVISLIVIVMLSGCDVGSTSRYQIAVAELGVYRVDTTTGEVVFGNAFRAHDKEKVLIIIPSDKKQINN